ncbi:hypothetical protein BC830DRAFT_1117011 [Chytriomyces sp. MP71]|nr:hypothetical protein BC830DRAFT_1117011 [Chytriomyces sp. MP71]
MDQQLPTELWALILIQAAPISNEGSPKIEYGRMLELSRLSKGMFSQRDRQTYPLTSSAYKAIFASTWTSAGFLAAVFVRGMGSALTLVEGDSGLQLLHRASLKPFAVLSRAVQNGDEAVRASRIGAGAFEIAKMVAVAPLLPAGSFSEPLLMDAVRACDCESDRLNAGIMRVTTQLLAANDRLYSALFPLSRATVCAAVHESCWTVFDLVVPDPTLSPHPPPWLNLGTNDIQSYILNRLQPETSFLMVSLFKLASCRQDVKFLCRILSYAAVIPDLAKVFHEEAPDALLFCCERGNCEVARVLLKLVSNRMKAETLRRCVVSRRTDLVEMIVSWYESHPPWTLEGDADDAKEFVSDTYLGPLVSDWMPEIPRYPCGVSQELWTRCIELACRDGTFEILHQLLVSPAGTTLYEDIPGAALHLAVLNNHVCTVDALTRKYGVPANRVAFATSISQNSAAVLQVLLQEGEGETGFPPPSGSVSFAIECRSFDVLKILLASRHSPLTASDVLFAAKFTVRESSSFSIPATETTIARTLNLLALVLETAPAALATEALNMSVHEGTIAVFDALLQAGAEANDATFTSSVFLNNAAMLDRLVERYAGNARVFQVALTCAVDVENVDILTRILAVSGAVPTASDLLLAARKPAPALVARFLLAAFPRLADAPLDVSVRQGNLSVVRVLVAYGAVPSLVCVTAAIEGLDLEILRVVLLGFSHGMQRTGDDGLVLGSAICSGRDDVVSVVLESGCFVPSSAHVYLAARRGMVLSVRLLLVTCGTVDGMGGAAIGTGSGGQSPLDLAVREGNVLAAAVLVNAGVKAGSYAIAAAVELGNVEMLLTLVGTEEVNRERIVPPVIVALAIQKGSPLMLKALLQVFHVQVSSVLLLMGVRRGNVQLVHILLQHYDATTIGKDVLDVALDTSFEVAELLIAFILEQTKVSDEA